MKKNKLLIAVAIVGFSGVTMAVEEKIDYTFNLKSWNNSLSAGSTSTSSTKLQSTNAPIIGLTARKGNYFVTFSTMLENSYNYKTSTQTTWIARKDRDFALGYRYTPNISIFTGYKTFNIHDGSLGYTNWKEEYSGVFVGLSGFNLINETTFLYGNLWVTPASMSQKKTAQADTVTNMKVINYEVGAGYALTNSSQLTLGYRIQDMKSTNTTQSNRTDHITMKGFLVGANINF
jgi:hypothetical protein